MIKEDKNVKVSEKTRKRFLQNLVASYYCRTEDTTNVR
jgi:hypothetical protein